MSLMQRLRQRSIMDSERLSSEAAAELERQAGEIERLRGLLTETQGFIVQGDDAGCEPGTCAECDMHRLALRIAAALTGPRIAL